MITKAESTTINFGVSEIMKQRLSSLSKQELLSFSLIACSRVGILQRIKDGAEPSASEMINALKEGVDTVFTAYDEAITTSKSLNLTKVDSYTPISETHILQ